MTSGDVNMVFMVSGSILFMIELKLKHPHMVISLLLAAASIFWAVLGTKYWAPTFPESFGWASIFILVLGVVSAVTILAKGNMGMKNPEE